MHTAPPLLLRRLEHSLPRSRVPQSNPFDNARRARVSQVLRVGLHSSLAISATASDQALLSALRTPLDHRAIEVAPVRGLMPAWMRFGRRFRLFASGLDYHEAVVRSREGGRRVTQSTPVSEHERWRLVAHSLGSGDDITALLELEALAALGSDLIVILDPALLSARGTTHLRHLNLMTPAEALVVVGVWSRTIHQAFIGQAGVNNGLYYWAAARALTPSAWPGHCAFVYATHVIPDGLKIADLAGSILDHLKSMVRGLDHILATWHCASGSDTDDEMLDEFAQMVGVAWSLHDNIALLVGRYLEIDMPAKHGTNWGLGKRAWMASVKRKGAQDPKAAAMLDLVERQINYVDAVRELRNDFAHRARGRMMQVSVRRLPNEGRVIIRGAMIESVRQRLDDTPEGAQAWGFDPVENLGTVEATDISTGERYEVPLGPRSLLDPVPFAARLLAYSAHLADETFRILDPLADDRIPHRDRCRAVPSGLWSRPEAAVQVIATSGVAGLA